MVQEEITLKSSATGRETTAPAALWIKCLLEMLSGPQLAELVRRVDECNGKVAIPGIRRHHRLIAEPGVIGLRGTKLGG
jgi:hypothetical protein